MARASEARTPRRCSAGRRRFSASPFCCLGRGNLLESTVSETVSWLFPAHRSITCLDDESPLASFGIRRRQSNQGSHDLQTARTSSDFDKLASVCLREEDGSLYVGTYIYIYVYAACIYAYIHSSFHGLSPLTEAPIDNGLYSSGFVFQDYPRYETQHKPYIVVALPVKGLAV